MVEKKTIGIALILIGILLLAGSLLVDIVGIGDVDPDHYTFGFKQLLGSVVGAVVALVGIFIALNNNVHIKSLLELYPPSQIGNVAAGA